MGRCTIFPRILTAIHTGQYVAGSMERMTEDVDCGNLSVGNFDAFRILIFVKFGAHCEARICSCRGN
jgi:hypothetical protein